MRCLPGDRFPHAHEPPATRQLGSRTGPRGDMALHRWALLVCRRRPAPTALLVALGVAVLLLALLPLRPSRFNYAFTGHAPGPHTSTFTVRVNPRPRVAPRGHNNPKNERTVFYHPRHLRGWRFRFRLWHGPAAATAATPCPPMPMELFLETPERSGPGRPGKALARNPNEIRNGDGIGGLGAAGGGKSAWEAGLAALERGYGLV
ncbi:unnamed protein product [Boreogadus saida]